MKNYQKNQHDFFTENYRMPNSKPKRKRIKESEVKENYLDIIKNTENYYFEYSFNFLPLLFGFFIVYSFAIPTVPAACLLGIITFTSIKVDMYKKEEE